MPDVRGPALAEVPIERFSDRRHMSSPDERAGDFRPRNRTAHRRRAGHLLADVDRRSCLR